MLTVVFLITKKLYRFFFFCFYWNNKHSYLIQVISRLKTRDWISFIAQPPWALLASMQMRESVSLVPTVCGMQCNMCIIMWDKPALHVFNSAPQMTIDVRRIIPSAVCRPGRSFQSEYSHTGHNRSLVGASRFEPTKCRLQHNIYSFQDHIT